MNHRRNSFIMAAAGFISCIMLVGFAFASGTVFSGSTYHTNSRGETYGSMLYANTPEEEPDLIAAEEVNGVLGYVRNEDLKGDMPASPEEAASIQQAREASGVTFRMIPLYASDGTTVIGQFKVGE